MASARAFSKGMRAWQSGTVSSLMASAREPSLYASVRDGTLRECQVNIHHVAGEELNVMCDCHAGGLCAHAVALMVSWSHDGYLFARAETTDDEAPASDDARRWHHLLESASMQQLRIIARRHQLKTRHADRDGLENDLIDFLSGTDALQKAVEQLSEAQKLALRMLFLLSDGEPDTLASELQRALGWPSAGDVDSELRELREWGLAVSMSTAWSPTDLYAPPPSIRSLVPSFAEPAGGDAGFVKPRGAGIKPYAGAISAAIETKPTTSLREILWLASRLSLRVRPASPEPAQGRTTRTLRQWPYVNDEFVRMQIKPGWMHQAESVLTVPPATALYDNRSLATLRELSGDDLLSDFAGHLLGSPSFMAGHAMPPAGKPSKPEGDEAGDGAGAIAPTLQQIFEAWQNLATWTELWAAQRAGPLVVRRSVIASRLTYGGWLQQLARGRRFVSRVLALLRPDVWYDAGSLLASLLEVQPDFLRERLPFATAVEPWWFELRGKKVDLQKYESWRDSYGLFVEQMLRGPLRWLGMVELAADEEAAGALRAFRITPLGTALLRGSEPPAASAPERPLVLSDDMTARLPTGRGNVGAYQTLERLACFERVAEGSACYRFEAAQAHAAFENGLSVEDALGELEQLAQGPVPAAVASAWREWWSRYAQTRWYEGVTLIELADDYILQELLTQTDLQEHILFTFGPRLVAVRPASADAITRQLVKKGYTPRIA